MLEPLYWEFYAWGKPNRRILVSLSRQMENLDVRYFQGLGYFGQHHLGHRLRFRRMIFEQHCKAAVNDQVKKKISQFCKFFLAEAN